MSKQAHQLQGPPSDEAQTYSVPSDQQCFSYDRSHYDKRLEQLLIWPFHHGWRVRRGVNQIVAHEGAQHRGTTLELMKQVQKLISGELDREAAKVQGLEVEAEGKMLMGFGLGQTRRYLQTLHPKG